MTHTGVDVITRSQSGALVGLMELCQAEASAVCVSAFYQNRWLNLSRPFATVLPLGQQETESVHRTRVPSVRFPPCHSAS